MTLETVKKTADFLRKISKKFTDFADFAILVAIDSIGFF